MTAATDKFESEAAMCAAFIQWAQRAKWVAYPETQGWDVLLVRGSDGFQIGVQAKQTLNLDVICQTLESRWDGGVGPDCRALLVPKSKMASQFASIAQNLRFTVITAEGPGEIDKRGNVKRPGGYWTQAFRPNLPNEGSSYFSDHGDWFERCPERRHVLPEYVPDVAAGASGPTQLTQWKIRAIRAAIWLHRQGAITRSELRALGMDPRRWTGNWLIPTERGFIAGPYMPNFKKQHPRNYAEIEADFAKWAQPLQAKLSEAS